MLNSVGQVVGTKEFSHAADSSTEAMELTKRLAKDTYIFELTGPVNKKVTDQVFLK